MAKEDGVLVSFRGAEEGRTQVSSSYHREGGNYKKLSSWGKSNCYDSKHVDVGYEEICSLHDISRS